MKHLKTTISNAELGLLRKETTGFIVAVRETRAYCLQHNTWLDRYSFCGINVMGVEFDNKDELTTINEAISDGYEVVWFATTVEQNEYLETKQLV